MQQAIREILSQAQIAALDEDGQLVFYRALPGQTTPERCRPCRAPACARARASSLIGSPTRRRGSASTAPPARLDRLLAALEVERRQRDIINDSLQDWRDRDEVHRLNGAESETSISGCPFRTARGTAISRTCPSCSRSAASARSSTWRDGRPGLGDLVTAVAAVAST